MTPRLPYNSADNDAPQSFADYDLQFLGIDHEDDDADFDATLAAKAYEGDVDAIVDALRVIINYTHFNVPAKHRLDETDGVLSSAATALLEQAKTVEAIARYCDELGIKVHIDADGPAVWLGDQLRAGAYKHQLPQVGRP